MSADHQFIQDFESGALPREDWNHAAHVRMTWYYLSHSPLSEASHKIRSGIQNFVRAKGLKATGYSETITLVYIQLIEAARISDSHSLSWEEFKNAHPELLDRNNPLPLIYYRRETIESEEAKLKFLEPDLQPLPKI